MDLVDLKRCVNNDLEQGYKPFAVIASAGTVSTGAIDPLADIAKICKQKDIWFHIDGAYGAVAACVPKMSDELSGIGMADSIAMDAHKWLYVPFEAGCVLVKNREHLTDAFAHETTYYPSTGGENSLPIAYRDQGIQTSRGFRALKVWMCLKTAGKDGYASMIGNNIRLAERLYASIEKLPHLEAVSQGLSIVTFRYIPEHIKDQARLNELNKKILAELQAEGWAYPSHAEIDGQYLIRVCITNFRTTDQDVDDLPQKVIIIGDNIS